MKLSSLLDAHLPIVSVDDIPQILSTLLGADDIDGNERRAMMCGYLMGLSYGIVEGADKAATELVLQQHEWSENGWL